MTEERGYKRAAVMWLVATGLCLWLTERHFSQLTANLITWIPFAMFLRCLWKAAQAKKLGRCGVDPIRWTVSGL